jgi:hypothetical protein
MSTLSEVYLLPAWLKIEEVCFSKALTNVYQTTRHHILFTVTAVDTSNPTRAQTSERCATTFVKVNLPPNTKQQHGCQRNY